MMALILIIMPFALCGVLLLVSSANIKTVWIHAISGVFLFALSIVSLYVAMTQSISQDTVDSVKVATISTNIDIYRDQTTGEYFRLISNDWNILDMYSREYISTEDAEKIIEVAEITSGWED